MRERRASIHAISKCVGVCKVGWEEAIWQAPKGVRAGTTTRLGGISQGVFASCNLGAHVHDEAASVRANRAQLRRALHLPSEPFWLTQVHGTQVAVYSPDRQAPIADAAVSFLPDQVLAVLTADCLPVVFASVDGQRLGIAHAGWRGLAAGVLEATVRALGEGPLTAWLGPAIGMQAFEVGEDVRAAFLQADPQAAFDFVANTRGRWQADLAGLARRRLRTLGVQVTGGAQCTYADARRFYSYRRDGQTGRMATLVWRRSSREG